MKDTKIGARLKRLREKLNTTGGKIVTGALLTVSMLSPSQEAQGANNNTDENLFRQNVKGQSLDNNDSYLLSREENGDMSRKAWSHKTDLGDGYSVMESSVTLVGEQGSMNKNTRMLMKPDGNTVSLDFLEMDKFITPSEQKINSDGSIEEKFDDGVTRLQAEKENAKTLAEMRKQLDENLDKTAADHVFSFVSTRLSESMNQVDHQKEILISNQITAQRMSSRS